MGTVLSHDAHDGSTVSVASKADRPLDVLAALGASAKQISQWRRDAVVRAREEGHSWAEIGKALGISKQAAWEQFNDDISEMLDEIAQRSGLTEEEAMKLAVAEVRAHRAEQRAKRS
jgi:hypothetical protein